MGGYGQTINLNLQMKFHVAAHACNSSRVLREENAEFRTRQLDLTLPPPPPTLQN